MNGAKLFSCIPSFGFGFIVVEISSGGKGRRVSIETVLCIGFGGVLRHHVGHSMARVMIGNSGIQIRRRLHPIARSSSGLRLGMVVTSFVDNLSDLPIQRPLNFLLHGTIGMCTLVIATWVFTSLDLLLSVLPPVVPVFRFLLPNVRLAVLGF